MELQTKFADSALDPDINVLLLATNRFAGEAIGAALMQVGGFKWLGTANTCEAAQRSLNGNDPDVIILNISKSVQDAVEQALEIRTSFPGGKLLALGKALGDSEMLSLVEAGIGTYCYMTKSLLELATLIRSLNEGIVSCSPWLLAKVVSRINELSAATNATIVSDLSASEQKTMHLMSLGMSNKQIATKLGISTSTVKNHVHRVLHKLEASTRQEAIRKAYKAGILSGAFYPNLLQETAT